MLFPGKPVKNPFIPVPDGPSPVEFQEIDGRELVTESDKDGCTDIRKRNKKWKPKPLNIKDTKHPLYGRTDQVKKVLAEKLVKAGYDEKIVHDMMKRDKK